MITASLEETIAILSDPDAMLELMEARAARVSRVSLPQSPTPLGSSFVDPSRRIHTE